MTKNSNDSKRKAKELQIPAQQTTRARTTRPAAAHNRSSAPSKRPSSQSGRPSPTVRGSANTPPPRRPSSGSYNGGGKKKKPMSKKKRFKMIYIVLAIILVLSLASIVAAKYAIPAIKAMQNVNKNRDKSYSDKDVDSNFENENDAAHMKGYLTLAVFGIDTRTKNEDTSTKIDDSDSRSDVIMIVNVNRETSQIKLLSVYRDTYLNIGTDKNGKIKCDKINHAYVKGQALNAINALNRNLDLHITDYVTVDFSIVTQCVDAVGGVEIEILDREIEKFNRNGTYKTKQPLINHYIDEINELTGSNSPHITKPGVQLLDGVQATAYARIRYCDTDYQRAERQRTVLMKMFEKAKGAGISTILKIAEAVAPQLVTSLEWSEIAELAKFALDCEIVDQKGFPFDMSEVNKLPGSDVWYNFSNDLVSDVSELHKYLFEQENYKPTSTVQTIADYIDKKRGKSSSKDYSNNDNDDNEDDSTYTKATTKPRQDYEDDEYQEQSEEPKVTSYVSKATTAPATQEPVYEDPIVTEEPIVTQQPVITDPPTPAPTIVYTEPPTPAPTIASPTNPPQNNPYEDEEPDDINNIT